MKLKLRSKASIDSEIDQEPDPVKKLKAPKNKPFKVTFVDSEGKEVTKKLKSFSRSELVSKLRMDGSEVVSVDEVKNFWDVEIGRSVPQKVLLQVTRQLAAFTSAGVPIISSLELLAESTKHKKMKKTLLEMASVIQDGDSLTQASQAHPSVFPGYYVAILEAAERTGDLASALDTLAGYLERDLASIRAVKSAMYYPIVLILLAIGAVISLSVIVLPRFVTFFTSLNVELPLATRLLMQMSSFFAANWIWVLLGLVLVVIFWFLIRMNDSGRYITDKAILSIPVFGKLIRIISLERFTRVLGSLTNAGVTLPDSMELATKVLGNSNFSRAISITREAVLRGEGLTEPLSKFKVFPQETIQILRVGEQTGQLVSQLRHASIYYAKEVDYKLKNLTSLIEPVVLIFVGGGVGFVAVALISAMYGVYSSTGL